MTFFSSSNTVVIASAAALGAVAVGLPLWWMLTHRRTPEEIERERRRVLVERGRIIDGTVLDWTEQPDTGDLHTLQYRYDIAGVTYECGQDLSHLADFIKIDASCLGMPASVRYDPQNPANSIVVAETWNGLYHLKSAHPASDGTTVARE